MRYIDHQSLMEEQVYHYKDGEEDWVEVHVDLIPTWWRQEHGTKRKIRGRTVSMGGCLSIRYNQQWWSETTSTVRRSIKMIESMHPTRQYFRRSWIECSDSELV